MLDDNAIREALADHVDRNRRAHGMIVGVVSPAGPRIVAYGVRGLSDPTPVDAETLFEIGSATKVFTALLLAEAARRGELAIDDAAQDRLPPGVRLPERAARRITLRDLATHSSGLPMFPPGSPPFGDPAWGRYSASDLFVAIETFVLPRDPGVVWEYSNTGYGLLGQALSFSAGLDYESLARRRILAPLGMASTAIALSPALEVRAATPHGADLSPTSRLQLSGLEGAGGLWSCAEDMLSFLSAAVGLRETPLAEGFSRLLDTPRIAIPLGAEQAIGWWVWPSAAGPVLNHDGGTAGFATSIFCDVQTKSGVVVLSNSGVPVSDLARRIMKPDEPAPTPSAPASAQASVDEGQLDRLVGAYETPSGARIIIERQADSLWLQAPNAPRIALSAASRTDFASTVAGVTATFELGPDGRSTGLVVNFAGRRSEARRLD